MCLPRMKSVSVVPVIAVRLTGSRHGIPLHSACTSHLPRAVVPFGMSLLGGPVRHVCLSVACYCDFSEFAQICARLRLGATGECERSAVLLFSVARAYELGPPCRLLA